MYDDSLLARDRRSRLSQTDTWVPRRDEVKKLVAILAHERLDVVTRYVVPLDTVVVKVVQDGQTRLVVTLCSFAVVWLWLTVSSSVAPVSGVTLACRTDLGARSGPEPSVNILGLKICSVAAVEVALTARCPNVSHVSSR